MSESSVTIIESQADWLTGACVTKDRADALRAWATDLAHAEEQDGNKLARFAVQSYQGHRCGRVAVAEAEGGRTLIQLSGDLAAKQLNAVLPLLDHLTRIDLAVTVRTSTPDKTVADNAWTLASWFFDHHPRSAAPWRIQHKTQGDTTYVGSRNSDKFLRIYDKQAECKKKHDAKGLDRYENCWRYEVEIKGKPALLTAQRVHDAPDRTAYVRGAMTNYLKLHGIEPIYTDDSPAVILPGFTRRTDADSRLWSLARNSRPSVEWLIDAGYAQDAIAALGLESRMLPAHTEANVDERSHQGSDRTRNFRDLRGHNLPVDLVARSQRPTLRRQRSDSGNGPGRPDRRDDGDPASRGSEQGEWWGEPRELPQDDDDHYFFDTEGPELGGDERD